MNPRKFFVILGGMALAAASVLAVPAADRHGRNVSMHDDDVVNGCDDLHITLDSDKPVMQMEEKTITKAEASLLRVKAEENGGVQVRGWDQPNYSVTLCKFARPKNADAVLSQIKLTVSGGEVSVSGPTHGDNWTAFLLVKAPKGAALELRANNGPMSVYNVDGKVTARVVNGPLTVSGCTGDLNLSAQNGPISSSENSGQLKLRAENGPVDVSLNGDSWKGTGLEASTQNGPLSVKVPRGFKSGVVVESDGHSPFTCHSDACTEARKTWDDEHKRVEFGSGPTIVHVSTVNGPVSID